MTDQPSPSSQEGGGPRSSPPSQEEASTTTAVPVQPAIQATEPTSRPSPSRPAASAKGRCARLGCPERAVRIIGQCRYCTLAYCSKHRLPEAHACSNLQHCKEVASSSLAERLRREKTVGQKV